MRIQDKKTYNATMRKQKIQCGGLQLSSFIKYGRKLFSIKRNLFIEGNIKRETKLCVKFLVNFMGKNITNAIFTKVKLSQ